MECLVEFSGWVFFFLKVLLQCLVLGLVIVVLGVVIELVIGLGQKVLRKVALRRKNGQRGS